MNNKQAWEFATSIVKRHNAAAEEFKQAFKKYGVHMWRDDEAHAASGMAVAFIASNIADGMDPMFFALNAIVRPLTVCDGQKISKANRRKLEMEVEQIYRRYAPQGGK